MASSINASTTAGVVTTADTSGVLNIQTAGTTAISIDASQAVSFTNSPTVTGGTANGVAYLNGSKVLTTGSALVFDGTNLGLGAPSAWGGSYKALQANRASLSSVGGTVFLGANFYNNGTSSTYIATDFASLYGMADGQHRFYTAPSGTAGNAITFTQAMTLDSSGNLGIGTTSPAKKLDVYLGTTGTVGQYLRNSTINLLSQIDGTTSAQFGTETSHPLVFLTANTERARIDTSGNLLVGTTSTTVGAGGSGVYGFRVDSASGIVQSATSGNLTAIFNRTTNDGTIVSLRQDGTEEGTISVSGTTVSYNGGHLARYAQTTTAKDESLVKGTVLSNLDEMNVYADADGNPVANEQLNKVKVSNTEGDANVAGVFVNWSYDEQHSVDEINMAMTGDMIIRIAQGVTVARGDLLMSAGDGTAKPQGDDIVRSKTVAKVTSTHVTCTYADGSYCVPCVLMAC